MQRDALAQLLEWKARTRRKPLIIKGARQVGKTWLARALGETFEDFVEFNFERAPELSEIFTRGLDPRRIVQELSAACGRSIEPGRSLVFLDEIQQSPPAMRSLRYFYEELPELHVVVAGSLLNTVLDKVPTGVGRISYLNLYPMSFAEYLDAADDSELRAQIRHQPDNEPLLSLHHERLLDHVRVYMLIGGMPAVLEQYFEDGDILACQRLQDELLRSYQDDFHKYARQADIQHLTTVFQAIPKQLGRKFVYAHVDAGVKSTVLSRALTLLELAGLAHKVYHTTGDGLPLAAGIQSNRFKVLFFDLGLAQRMLDLDLKEWMTSVDIATVNKGAVAEQFVGQELAVYQGATHQTPLTYWHREARGSRAEVDYLIPAGRRIVPVEVKAGVKGGMKSLRLFLQERRAVEGVRVSKDPFSNDGVIRSIPLYGIEQLFASS